MLYSIALQIGGSKIKAEKLLITTFKKLYCQEINFYQESIYCIKLMQILIGTVKELYPKKIKENFRLKQFENTPFINQLICHQISLQDYCNEKHLTPQEGMQIIRTEFNFIKNVDVSDINYTIPVFLENA